MNRRTSSLPFNYEWFGESIIQVNNSIAGGPHQPFMVYLIPLLEQQTDDEIYNNLGDLAKKHANEGLLHLKNENEIFDFASQKRD